ncbi:MAG TPA: type IV pilus secretin PilQ [Thermoanaerobaculia bacterium]|nr:type IV pilus secretin PilQ [Thermoanaerobaculia bacterium]
MHRRSALGQLLIASAVAATAIAAGCTASRPAKVVQARPAARPASASADTKRDTTLGTTPNEIRSLEVREGAPEVYVDVKSSAAPVWTSFRNAQGQVVIELPNTVPAATVADLAPADGLVASIKVQRENDGSRPLTRLVVETRQEVEHSVTAENLDLHVRLTPVDGEKRASLSGETAAKGAAPAPAKVEPEPPPPPPPPPVPAAAAPTPAPAPTSSPAPAPADTAAPAPAASAGTAEQPVKAPAPKGATATHLDSVEVVSTNGDAVVKISGDGEFPYQTFALSDPARFVIDLSGVLNRSSRATVNVEHGVVQRVRVAQFKPQPQPVARVVFDLRRGVVPHIERMAKAMMVTFASSGAEGAAPAAAAATGSSAAPAPAPAPRISAAEPPPAPPAPPAHTTEMAANHSEPPPPPPPAPSRSGRSKKGRKSAPAPADTAPAPAANLASVSTPTIKASSSSHKNDGMPAGSPVPATGAASAAGVAAKGQPSDLQLNRTPGSGAAMGSPTSAAESFSSQAVGQQGERTYVGEPIDLKVTNADVTDVLRTFAQLSGLNIVVQPGVTGQVTAEMENVPWDQALEQVLKINKLGYELEGNVMRIAPVSILREEAQEKQELAAARALAIPLRTIMKPLSYARAVDIASLLKSGQAGLLSQRGSVIVDTRTNTLIIKELPNFLDTIIAVIEQLDTPEPQVMIEARIIETTKNFNRDLGINWSFNGVADAAHGNTTGLIFPNNGSLNGTVDVHGSTGNVLKLHLGNVLNTFTLDAALQAAENEGLIHILSAPKVATLNNQRASIQSGLQIPVQTIANNTVTVQFVNATLRLDVTPQVTAEGTVLMDIDISKREPQLAFLVPGSTNAPIATKDARTRLVVRDGGTAVIGGIYKITNSESEARIPGLANIPILGNLFKNHSRADTNEELLIFITPRVIKL